MPRRPLEDISANIPRGEELTPSTRSKIVTLREEGFAIRDISTHTKISKSTIKKTVKIDLYRNGGNSLRRTGRPKKYTERDKCQIIRFVQIHPKSTYTDIRQNLHIYLSYNIFSRILDSVGIKNWRAKGRPTLDPEDAKR
jgi:transposase